MQQIVDINNINHVGMAVRDLAAAATRYEAMGFQLTPYSPHSAAWKPGDTHHASAERSSPATCYSVRLSGEERISEDRKLSRVFLTACTLKGVNRRPDLDVDEPNVFKHLFPGCTRQTTGDSSGPKIDVLDRCLRYRLAVGDIRELKSPAWA